MDHAAAKADHEAHKADMKMDHEAHKAEMKMDHEARKLDHEAHKAEMKMDHEAHKAEHEMKAEANKGRCVVLELLVYVYTQPTKLDKVSTYVQYSKPSGYRSWVVID